ncbi:MAG: glycosyltransferase family 4 protein [Pyrinomonadaceae bacterium]
MRILLCKNSFAGPISGADEIAVNYAIGLKAAGHEASVLLVQPPTESDPLAARLAAAGVPLSALASPRFTASLAAGRRMALATMRAFPPTRELLRAKSRRVVHELLQRYHDAFRERLASLRPDVVHVITPDPGAVMLIRAAHAAGVPVVYQEVGTPFHPPGFEEVYERFVKVLPLCAGVATLSPRLARAMRRLASLNETPRVVPLIAPDTAAGEWPAPRPPGAPVLFGFASRLEHLKGPLDFVEGFAAAARGGRPAVEARVAGEGSQHRRITAALRRHGLEKAARLVGTYTTFEERGRFMREIDVFVHPSLTEGTPNVVIEAMAHGRPVIATAVGGLPDIVTEEAGVLVQPGDTAALGEAMRRLAADPALRRSMGHAAREQYLRLFTGEVVMPLLTEFYRDVMEGSAARRPEKFRHPWAAEADDEEEFGVARRDGFAAMAASD